MRRRRLHRALVTFALTAGLATAGLTVPASASTAPIGPECAENVQAAVLAAVAGQVSPGQIIQYLQITADGQLQMCTVTVPGAG